MRPRVVIDRLFAPIITRNTPLPASRTEIYATVQDGQKAVDVKVYQGEDDDCRFNSLVGRFTIDGLADVSRGNQLLVRLDLDLNGILKVTATDRATGLARHVTIDNAMEKFRTKQRSDAIDRLDELFEDEEAPSELELENPAEAGEAVPDSLREAIDPANALIAKAGRVREGANAEDAAELDAMIADLNAAIERRSEDDILKIAAEVEDLVFYLEDQ